MHYCICVITDEFPSLKVIEEKMKPYNEYDYDDEKDERPRILWDGWQIGGRYCGRIKMKVNREDEKYEWGFYNPEPRAGRLYRSMMMEGCIAAGKMVPIGNELWHCREEDYYNYLGYRDGYLRVDGCAVKDVIDFEENATSTWGFIGKDGEVYTRNYWNREQEEWVDDEEYEDKVKAAIADVNDCYITFVDIHH